ncbi:uncharacterized protein [Macrobrachium rosenbergii]|uniref:uncharacterized protein n=1 Tax=Macrobrachium rosenbergii TaxID=79674 RepID=UPI0034D661EC
MCAGSTQERTQGATRGSEVTVKCTVEAEPSSDLSWSWVKIREDANEEEALEGGQVTSGDLSSSVSFVPRTQDDYGRILCRATNAVGTQRKACVVNLVPAGPPDPPYNCSATPMETEVANKVTAEPTLEVSLSVTCMEGFDGGLPQEFLMVGYRDDDVIVNSSSEFPEWVIRGMERDMSVMLFITAHNARGSSPVISVEAHTSVAQQRAATGQDETDQNMVPLLGALIGGLSVLLMLLAAAIFMAKRETPRNNRKPVTEVTFAAASPEGFDPDVVQFIQRAPHNLDVVPCPKGLRHQHPQDANDSAASLDLEACGAVKGCARCSGAKAPKGPQAQSRRISSSPLPVQFNCHCRRLKDPGHRERESSGGGGDQVSGSNTSNLKPGTSDLQREPVEDKTGVHKNNPNLCNESHCCPLSQPSYATSSLTPNFQETYQEAHQLPHQSYPSEYFVPSAGEVPQMTTVFCSQCHSLPRPSSQEVKYYHQQSLRDLRSSMRGSTGRLSSSASLGQLKNLSMSQKELFYSSAKDFQVQFASKENQGSVAAPKLGYGRQNTLPRPRQKQILDSAVDINIAIPDERGSIMIMKLLSDDKHQPEFQLEPSVQPQRSLLRRTLSEVQCPKAYKQGKVYLQSFGHRDPNVKQSCVSLNDSDAYPGTEEKCMPSKGCPVGSVCTDRIETNPEHIPLNSEYTDSKHYVKVAIENRKYLVSKEKTPPSYEVISQKDHDMVSHRPQFPYKKIPQESSV